MSNFHRRARRVAALGALATALLTASCVQRDVISVTIAEITVQPGTGSLLDRETLQFQAIVRDDTGRTLPRASVTWTSENPEYLSIDATGMATAVGAGTTRVLATFRGVTGSANVTVIPAPTIELSQDTAVFFGAVGAAAPDPIVVDVRNGGGGVLDGLVLDVVYAGGQPTDWLTPTLEDTRAPTELTLTPVTATLPVGTFDATVTVTSPDDADSPVFLDVRLSLTGFTVTESGGSTLVTEAGGTDQLTVVLDAAPDSDVVLTVTTGDPGEVTASPAVLTFTPLDWNTPQTVVLIGQDEAVADGDQVTDVVVSVDPDLSDAAFAPIPDRIVAVTTVDDDTPGFTLAETGGSTAISESGSTDVFTVVLDAQPLSPVMFDIASSDPTEASAGPTRVTFTGTDWSAPQTVTVTGVDDDLIDGAQTGYVVVSIDPATSDDAFDAVSPDSVEVVTSDDDAAGFVVTEAPPTGVGEALSQVTEAGATDAATVVLGAEPVADVVLTIVSGDQAEVTVTPGVLTFTPANWNTPVALTLTGVDDALIDGNQTTPVTIAIDVAASDPAFGALPAFVFNVVTIDDDSAGVSISEPGGGTTVAESGTTDAFAVVLQARPLVDVVLLITSADTTEVTAAPSTLTFTTTDWSAPQQVTVTGVDELIDDGDRLTNVLISVDAPASDPDFGSLPPDSVVVTTTDDDTAGLTVFESGANTLVSEGGLTDTVTVVLDAEPRSNVQVSIITQDPLVATVSSTSLTFTPVDWSTPQPVIVIGTDDLAADGDQSTLIAISVVTALSDSTYQNVPGVAIGVTTQDNDAPAGFQVDDFGGVSVTEGSVPDNFGVVLSTEPPTPVTIDVTPTDNTEVAVNPATLTFTSATWNVRQTVTVVAVDDNIIDGTVPSSITVAVAAGSDPNFLGLTQNVAVTTADDDVAGLVFTDTTNLTVGENGPAAGFRVQLTAEPDIPVVLAMAVSDSTEVSSDSATVTLDASNWDLPQDVPLTGVDDTLVDGTIASVVNVTVAAGSDPNFLGLTADIGVRTTDDDAVGLVFSDTLGLTVDETGSVDAFRVRLTAAPADSVVLSITSGDTGEVISDSTTLVLDATNWSVPQDVPLTGVDDAIVDGVQTTLMTVTATAGDPLFLGLTGDVGVTTTDDDVAAFALGSTAGLVVTEAGSTATFTVVLLRQPLSPVVFSISTSDPGEVIPDSTSLRFTGANWSTPQPVPLRGIDDFFVDGSQFATITVAVNPTFSDTAFVGLSAAASVTTTDDDTAAYTLTGTSGITLTEAGSTAAITVRLDAQPLATPVVLTLTANDPTEVTADSTVLTFTNANWNLTKTVVLRGRDDALIDGDVASTVTVAVDTAATEAAFDAMPPTTFGLTTLDDDAAGFTVAEFGGVSVNEAGGTDNFTVVLDAEPTSPVLISVASDDTAELTVSTGLLTFLPANWDSAQSVTVTGIDDGADEPDGTVQVLLAVQQPGSDPAFTSLADTVVVTTFDDDGVGFTVTEAGGTTVRENAFTDNFTVVLTSQPLTDVVLSITSGDPTEVSATPDSLTFTTLDWSTVQVVTVSAVDDFVIDPNTLTTVAIAIDSTRTDAAYDSLPPKAVVVTAQSDDVAGLALSDTTGMVVTELGSVRVFQVALEAEPTAPVVVNITSSDPTEVLPDSTSLTFTAANWNTQQPVPLRGQNDSDIDGNMLSTVTVAVAAGSDAPFLGLSRAVSVTTSDDELGGFALAGTVGLTVAEDGTPDSFTAVLTASPTTPVIINVASSDVGEVVPDSSSLTFDATNWNTPRAIPLSGVDDPTVDGSVTSSITVSIDPASDPNFLTVPNQVVTVVTTDDDIPGLTLTDTLALSVSEPATVDTFFVELARQPIAPVVLSIGTSDPTEVVPDSTSLIFNASNWNTPQPVPVRAVDDAIIDGPRLSTITVGVNPPSSDDAWDGVASLGVSVATVDDDLAGLLLTDTLNLSVNESGTSATFRVRLTAQPAVPVVLNISTNDPTELTPDSTSLSFDASNWSVFQPAPLTAVDDSIIDGTQSSLVTVAVAAGSDTPFLGLSTVIGAQTVDDDASGFTLANTTGLSVTEGGSTTQFTVQLDAQPSSPVVLTIASDDPGEVTPDSTSLTFTSADWSTPKPVAVRGADDVVIDGDQVSTITVAVLVPGSDPAFAGVPSQGVTVTTIDDDGPGFTMTDTLGLTVTEAGGTDQFSVRLNAQPASSVLLMIATSDSSEATADSASVTFTTGNWNQQQSIVIRGIDDSVIDFGVQSTITLSVDVGASDPAWSAVAPQVATVTTLDDDLAGITLADTASLSVTEAGSTVIFRVRLTAEPNTAVTLGVSSSDPSEATPDSTTLTFDATNWNVFKDVPITGIDDALLDGTVTSTISLSPLAGSDPNFLGLVRNVSVQTTDDDTSGLIFADTTALSVDESGTTAVFRVRLTAQPASDVVLLVTTSDSSEVVSDSTSLLLDGSNWNSLQDVPLRGVDDPAVDGLVASVITVAVQAGSDPDFLGLTQNVGVTTTDDDIAGFTLADTTALSVSEPSTSTVTPFTVVLDRQPIAPVVFTISSSDPTEVLPDSTSLTFDATNWNIAQPVPLTAVDDAMVDGPIVSSITVAVALGSDASFLGLTQAVSVTTNDDDAPGLALTDTTNLTVTEAGSVAIFRVRLTAQPATSVFIDIVTSDSTEVVPDTTSLTFDATDWNVFQRVRLTGIDDGLIDGSVPSTITVAVAAGSDPIFAGQTAVVGVTTTDDDVASLTVVELGGTRVTEAGSTDDFSVVLTAEPVSDVVMSVTSLNTLEVVVSTDSLTFTPLNWDTAQVVTVTGVDDAVDDGDQVTLIPIEVDAARSDDAFDLLADTVSVTTSDDDGVGFIVTEIGSTVVSEQGLSDEFAVRLTAQPLTDVVLSVVSGDLTEATVAALIGTADSLTFTAGDWNVDQAVRVTGVDDTIVDGPVVTVVTVAIDSTRTDAAFDTLPAQPVNVTTLDDEVPGFVFADTTALQVSEDGVTLVDQFLLSLTGEPETPVVVVLTMSDSSEVLSDSASLTFDATNWNVPQVVPLVGVNDVTVDGDISSLITVAVDVPSSDPLWSGVVGQNVGVVTNDDDVPDFTLGNAGSLTVTEPAGTDQFTVVLDRQPVNQVVFLLSSSDPSAVIPDSASLTFTPANWNVVQPVPLTAVDDDLIEGPVVSQIDVAINAGSSDAFWALVAAQSANVTTVSEDTAGLVLADTTALVVSEDGVTTTAFFRLSLTAEPDVPVTVTLAMSDSTEVVSDSTSLVFDGTNWNLPQIVPLLGVDDPLVDGPIPSQVTVAVAGGSDPNFLGQARTFSVTTTDDEVPTYSLLGAVNLAVAEPAQDTFFQVVLDEQPVNFVEFTITTDDPSEVVPDSTSLRFTTLNWNVAQPVPLLAVDDNIADGPMPSEITVAVNVGASDALWAFSGPVVAGVITVDDDVAGITVTPTSGLTTTEAGAGTAQFTVTLDSEPTADVTIGISSNDPTEGTVSTSSLVLTSANYIAGLPVTITGVDDAVDDGDIPYTIVTAAATSGDPNYNGVDPDDVSVTNTDDDTFGITVTPTSGLTTTEAGAGTAQFTVTLDSEPTADVTIGISSSDLTEGTVSTSSLVLTSANYIAGLPVTITGVDDAVDDGDIPYTIVTAATTSGDPNYNGVDPDDVSVTNTDDDTFGITVTPTSGLTTTEAGAGTAQFTVTLDSEPTADVTIGISSSDLTEGTVSTSSLVLTSANYIAGLPVTITGVDDAVDDGDIPYTIVTAATTSGDPNYNGVDPDDVSVTNIDDDTAGLAFADTLNLTVPEDGVTVATFRVSLTAEPLSPVTLTFQSDSLEAISDSATVLFTSTNWNTLVDVPVRGVDELTVDGDTTTILTVAVLAGSDAAFLSLSQDIGVTTIDDDDAGFTLTETGSSTDVNDAPTPASDTINVVLDRRPQNPVTINVTSANPSIVSVVTTSVAFTPANWDTPQPVTVSGVSGSVTSNTTIDVTFSVDPSSNVEFLGLPDEVITVNVTNTN